MKMNGCWARATRDRSSELSAARVSTLFLLASLCSAATPLETLQKSYRAAPTPDGRAKLLAYVQTHPRDAGAIRLTLGITALAQKEYPDAMEQLKLAQAKLPRIADYIAYSLASADEQSGQYGDAIAQLAPETFTALQSPLAAKAALLRAKAFVENHQPSEAIRVLRDVHDSLPQPDADFALASAYDAQGEPAQAAILYQRVYYRYPATEAAAQAAGALDRLRGAMGTEFPAPMPQQLLQRGDRWLAAKEFGKAKLEFQSAIPQLGGLERDTARVRAGEADYYSGDYGGAFHYLKELHIARSEADAERDSFLVECARKMTDDEEMADALEQLRKHYEKSPWRSKALVSAGNRYLLEHRPDRYEPLYRAAYETFPADSTAAYCHWKVAWNAYFTRRKDAAELLREHVERYPADARSCTALYFLGRLAESAGDLAAARAYYAKLTQLFPHYYYAVLARERLKKTKPIGGNASDDATVWLAAVEFPARETVVAAEATPATRMRVERARLLASGGLPDWAEAELRFGATNGGQAYLLATELARTTDSPSQSLRFMKSYAPDYLAMKLEKAPKQFWQLLFPLPYQKSLVRYAAQQKLDPYLLAALIRQESEFNPAALSHANAYGLTQIMPATGRSLAKQNGIRAFRTSMLFEPETNLRLGTMYLRSMLDQWSGRWEETLASYNAGKRHVQEWLAWASYQEPAEFVESIPFTETREYVQAVLRNADIYREIYGARATPKKRPASRRRG